MLSFLPKGPRATGLALLALLTATSMAQAQTHPRVMSPRVMSPRVMSIDNCANQYLMALADREQIVSLAKGGDQTTLAFLSARVEGVPRNHRTVEEMVAARPDILLTGQWAMSAAKVAKHFGVRVVALEAPRDIAQARRQILDVAHLLGQEERGRALVADLDQSLAEAAARRKQHRTEGVVYRSGGYAYGADTLVDSIMDGAGIANVAARLGLRRAGNIDMETLLVARPQVMLDDQARDARDPRIATDFLAHPALRRGLPQATRIQFPMAYWLCGGEALPMAVSSLATLVSERDAKREDVR
ncbi:ABC transporter substrate-binding protein [Magnetospirillum aberrantis]|uniref:ABC transporter substrate-binding protein n=1 Tax=Magnetospirillum aberrantis SpK TaxID=908842 RepID=A0A7C9UX16_9PROT|nr:ABC transporter substrate-binding protein [Magnetospirillum aberrantis]NFV78811.1 ABC transporter substrate-binding protein [Magnetospirillum aberrantis SpK]